MAQANKKRRFPRLKKFLLITTILIIIVYLLRGIIVSPLICRTLEIVIAKTTKIELTIGHFGGSYFTSIVIEDVRLVDGADILERLRVKKITVYYNPLALLSGSRILSRVEVVDPEIIVVSSKTTKPKKKAEKKGSALAIAKILEKIPDIIINNAKLGCRLQGNILSVEKLNVQITPDGGCIAIDKIGVQTPILPTDHAIRSVYLQWRFDKLQQKLVMQKARGLLEGYRDNILTITQPLVLDLKEIGRYPLEFKLPLPGALLSGKAIIDNGLQLEITEWKNDFAKMLKMASFIKGQELKSFHAGLAVRLTLSLPEWDPRQLNGRMMLRLCRQTDIDAGRFDALDEEGFQLVINLDDLAVVTDLLHSLKPEMKRVNLDGSLKIHNILQTTAQEIILRGSLSAPRLAVNKVEFLPINGKWNLSGAQNGEWFRLKEFRIEQGKSMAQVRANVDMTGKTASNLEAEITAVDIHRQLQRLRRQRLPIETSLQTSLRISGHLPRPGKKSDFNGKFSLKANALAVNIQGQLRQLGDLQIGADWRLAVANRSTEKFSPKSALAIVPDKLQLQQLFVQLDKQRLLTLTGNASLRPGSKFAISGSFGYRGIEKLLAQLVSQPLPEIHGDIQGTIDFHGNLADGQKPLTGEGRIELTWRQPTRPGKIDPVKLTIDCRLSPTSLAAKVDCSVRLKPLEKYWQLISPQLPPLSGQLALLCHSEAQVPLALLRSGAFGDVRRLVQQVAVKTHLKLQLDDLNFRRRQIPALALIADLQLAKALLNIRRISLHCDQRQLFRLTGEIDSQLDQSSSLACRAVFDPVEQYLGYFLPTKKIPCAGKLTINLQNQGKLPIEYLLSGKKLDLEAILRRLSWQTTANLEVQRGRLQGKHLPELSLLARLGFANETLTIDPLTLKIDRRPACQIRAKLFGDASRRSSFACRLVVDSRQPYIQRLLAADKPLPANGKINFQLDGVGNVPLLQLAEVDRGNWRQVLGQINWATTIAARVNAGEYAGRRLAPLELHSKIRLAGLALTVQPLQLSLAGKNVMALRAHVTAESGKRSSMECRWQFDPAAPHLRPFLPGTSPVSGAVTVELKSAGVLPVAHWLERKEKFAPADIISRLHWDNELKVELAHGQFQGQTLPLLALVNRLQLRQGKIAVKEMSLALAGRKLLSCKAKLDWTDGAGSYNCRLGVANLEKYWQRFGDGQRPAPLAGDLELGVTGSGQIPINYLLDSGGAFDMAELLRRWRWHTGIDLRLSNGELQSRQLPAAAFVADIDWKNMALDIEPMVFRLAKQDVCTVRAHIEPLGTSRYSCQIAIESIERYLQSGLAPSPLSGDFLFDLRGEGKLPLMALLETQAPLEKFLQDLAWKNHLDFKLKRAKIQQLPVGNAHLAFGLVADAGDLTIRQCYLDWESLRLVELSGKLGYRPGRSSSIHGQIPLAAIVNRLAAMVDSDNNEQNITPAIYWKGKAPLQFTLHGNLPVDPQRRCRLELDLNAPFLCESQRQYWQLCLGDIELWGQKRANGMPIGISGYAKLSGTLDRPQFLAKITVRQEVIRLSEQDFKIRNFFCEISADNAVVLVDSHASVGGGSLTCRGQLDLTKQWLPHQFRFVIQGNRILLVRSDELYGRADLAIVLQGRFFREKITRPLQCKAQLGGLITIPNFEVSQSMSFDRPPERVMLPIGVDIPNVQLDLNLQIALKSIAIKNNLAEINTHGDIWIKGQARQPEISGWVSTTSGKLFLPQGNMNITHCLIRFKPEKPLVPHIDIRAETQVRHYQIFVTIKGTPANLIVEFSSVPALPQEDVITLLVTGATRSELEASGKQKLMETGSFILLQQVFSAIGIASYVSAQVTDEYGAVTLTLTPKFALQGMVDQEGNTQFNILYRIRFK